MARALTEVVLQTELPDGPLRHLTTAEPAGRITLTPLVVNGSGYPTRFLASATGFDERRRMVLEALGTFLDGVRIIHEDDRTTSFVGELSPATRQALDATIGEAMQGLAKDLVFRPSLFRAGHLHVSIICTHETPVEESVHRVTKLLGDRSMKARLVRLEAYHPEHQGLGTYDEALTPKQAEILKMALALGLYDTPRRCTLDDLAEVFGISKAAAHNRMKGAERKILARYFDA